MLVPSSLINFTFLIFRADLFIFFIVFVSEIIKTFVNLFFSKNLLNSYYNDVFPWLENCEKLFGFKDLKGYGLTRIYGFLAERFMSYWFKKNAKYKELPILFHDISKTY